ncbi:GntR family transcriptional regulator [Lysinibacillus sp. NPDC097279]|jgi:DNA-binding GntR family transcriptional regulator|uniref:GntR family transcriptional regulator n=1 Tax=unclassified Lysinibacillus TaxID=2636778 RepID=UPI00116804A6|nr:GntR family transcriptional regulator [Lysinibacillus sp. CD3-6]QPQ36300.1 GntR family transcriptional regulator [Lysinibacillus sp. JNUCC-52]UED82040.1 GntR family transcriptional regulator [Lysinibacillus sp. CD3-6]
MNNYLSLKDHVYNYIVDQINNGNLIAGKKVNESAISESLNVSRTPVREALIQLSSEGLLENVPRKGFVIKNLTTEEAKETYFIIGALDGLAAALAAPFLTEKHMNEMEFYIQSIDLAINTGNFSMYHKMQEAFHGVYLSVCPNKSLVNLLLQLEKKFLKNFHHADEPEITKKRLSQTNNEHRKMVELFKKGEIAELERYMKEVHWNIDKAELIPL